MTRFRCSTIHCVLFSFILLFLVFRSSPAAAAAEQIIVNVTLNTENKGDFLVLRSPDGDFLVRESDLAGFGISLPPGKERSIDGEKYYSLRSLSGISYTFNENRVSLNLQVAPELLPTNTIDLFPPRRTDIYYPRDFGAFLNYGIDYNHSSPGEDSVTATQQVGIQRDNILLLSDSVYTDNSSTHKFVRLMSSLNIDDRNSLTRFVAGDSVSSSGDLGSTVNLGGVSFSKVYRMNPYLITYPTIHFAGMATLPSDVELYVNGMRMRTEKLAAGGFDFRNITSYIGAGTVEIVLRDPFGREQRISQPFYFTNQLLREGLHEYSYSAGFERKEFGIDSNRYGRFAFSGFHRYGVTDTLTVGGSAEGTSSAVAFSGQGSWLFPKFGILAASAGASLGETGKNGLAGSASYTYQSVDFNARLAVRGFTPGYTVVAGSTEGNRVRYDASAGVGYGTRKFGSISVSGAYSAQESGTQKIFTIAYARNLTPTTTLATNFSYGGQNSHESRFFAGITWNPAPNTVVSARVETTSHSTDEVAEIQKNAPIGEGIGYHALVGHSTNSADSVTFDAALQYNGRYGRYIGEYTGVDPSGSAIRNNYRLDVAGSILLLGGRIGFSRPVGDSFALVKVGNLEGVKVYQYAQEMGTTDSHGELFVPELGSFNDNLLSIKAGNIPLNYALKTIDRTVSPPFRSGSCVVFPVRKLQPVTGTLKATIDGKTKPLEFAEVTIDTDVGKVVIPTGLGGEFYWEGEAGKSPSQKENGCSAMSESVPPAIKPGHYRGTVALGNKTYRFEFYVPPSEAMIINLGDIMAEASAESDLEKREGEKTEPAAAPYPSREEPRKIQESSPPTADTEKQSAEAAGAVISGKAVLPPAESGESPVIEVYFNFGTANLASDNDNAAILKVARLLQTVPDFQVVIEGYADQIGSQRYNLLLSKRRARKIADTLKKNGVPDEKIRSIVWFGKKHLKCFRLAESCRKFNRRVVVRLGTTAGPR